MSDKQRTKQDEPFPSIETQVLSSTPEAVVKIPGERGPPTGKINVDTLIAKEGSQTVVLPPGKISTDVALDQGPLGHVKKDFDIIEQFAEGGQGQISSARDRILNRLVAIKSLKKNLLTDEHQVAGFLDEAGVTAKLDHPSVVPLYALYSDPEGGLHIAMKMVNGKTLTAYLREVFHLYQKRGLKAFDEREALFTRLGYFIKICEAISYAHDRGILHRDLKSDNIMIGEFGEVYVMDWGLAISRDEVADCSPEQLRQGTPGYMAPEVIRSKGLTEASDVFSLGAILFEMVTLSRAFSGVDIETILKNTVNGHLQPLEPRCEGMKIDSDLAAIIRKAMHADPGKRYPGVEALLDDVQSFMAGQEVTARPDNLARAVGRWLFIHKQQSLILFFSLLLLCAGFSIHVLVRKYQGEQTARHRQFILANIQHDVNAQSHRVDRHILKLEDALRTYAERAVFLLKFDVESTTNPNHQLHDYRELQDLAGAPDGTVDSPLYGENISLEFSSFKWAPGPIPTDGAAIVERLSPLDQGLLKVLVESDPEVQYDSADAKLFEQRAITEGFPLRYIYFGMNSGLLVCYPGKSRFDEAYDPRLRPWYQQAKQSDRVIWTKPYYDAFGQGLILSASYAVHDDAGELLGVASLDVTLEYIVNQLMRGGDRHPILPARRFLIDEQGFILLDSALSNMMDATKEEELAELQLKRYEHPEVERFLREGRGGQVQITGPQGPTILACSPISTANWYYLEQVPLDGVDYTHLADAWGEE